MADQFNSSAARNGTGESPRKPYARPRIVAREQLESAANVCSGFGLKSQPTEPAPGGGVCGQVGLQS